MPSRLANSVPLMYSSPVTDACLACITLWTYGLCCRLQALPEGCCQDSPCANRLGHLIPGNRGLLGADGRWLGKVGIGQALGEAV